MPKIGALVGWKGDVGLVVGKVKNIGAKTGDVWVWWTKDNLKLRWEHGPLLEVINESR
tara:strand:- start:352 stop:525 length:174 start_codon:yes stop_codon:yes gene_type:complete